MKAVAARYPAFDATLGRPLDLDQRINHCRTKQQQATPLPFDSHDLLALSAYVAHQSKGEPIAVAENAWTRPFIASGRALFEQRQGQLNLSCAQCHDDNWGKRLAGAPIPQAHPTGYPLYRLEWQALGSLRRRLRNCLVGMRAEPYLDDAPEIVDSTWHGAAVGCRSRAPPSGHRPHRYRRRNRLGSHRRLRLYRINDRCQARYSR